MRRPVPGVPILAVPILGVSILGVSVWGPGLEGWTVAAPVLAGLAAPGPGGVPLPPPTILPANERRRTGPVVRLALAVASEAVAAAGLDPASLRSVFGSANGDGPVVGGILQALSAGSETEGRLVSPTQFSNSVHNGAAGYWSIATGGGPSASCRSATCLGAGDGTWAAALLTACTEVMEAQAPVLLVVYDHPLPPPLDVTRPITAPFAVALVLAPPGAGRDITLAFDAAPATDWLPSQSSLHGLARGNPAAQSLRLLEHLARGDAGVCPAPYGAQSVQVVVT